MRRLFRRLRDAGSIEHPGGLKPAPPGRRGSSSRDARLARDVRQELEHHLAASTEYLIDRGLPAEAARAEARRRLGPIDEAERRLVPYARDREKRMRVRQWLESTLQDIRYAARNLRRQPVLTTVIVATLALGMGVNAAMYGIIDRLLLSGPAHVKEADRIVRLYFSRAGGDGPPRTHAATNYATFAGLRDGSASFAALAAYLTLPDEVLGEGADIERIAVQVSTASLFPLLGVHPAAGRFFDAREDTPPVGQPVAVLSHALWTRRFGADPSAIGRRIFLNQRPFTILGVAPRGFTGPELHRVDAWLPVSAGVYFPRSDWLTDWNSRWLTIIGRLKPGVSPAAAASEVTAVHRQVYGGSSETVRDMTLSARPLQYDATGHEPVEATVSRWLAGVAAVVLLIACANVANILLARGFQRHREVALRTALGITRGRLLRLLMAEVVVLAVAGGAAALVVGFWAGGFIQAVLLPDVVWDGLSTGRGLLLVTATATLATALLVAPLPALQGMRVNLAGSLREGTHQQGRLRSPMRYGLTVAQTALSVVLLVGAGLFVQSLVRVQQLDLGIEADRVVTARLTWPRGDAPADAQSAEADRRRTVTAQAIDRLRAMPGVASASAAIGLPFQFAFGVPVRAPGVDEIPELPGGGPYVSAVASGYFATVGTDLVRGRVFTSGEGRGTEPVVIVNDTMARTLWPQANALEQCLFIGPGEPPCSRVVGIVEDTRRFRLREDPAMQFYVPMGQQTSFSGVSLLVRPSDEAAATAPAIRRELHALDPTLAYVKIVPLREEVDPQVRPWRLGATLFLAFGALAFLIAAIGLYSVLAHATAQRSHEMAIRLALGARRGEVLALVVRTGVVVAAAGILLGALIALAAGPYLEPLLFETPPRSPIVFAVVIGVLLASALVASYIPARRATQVDPIVVLRS